MIRRPARNPTSTPRHAPVALGAALALACLFAGTGRAQLLSGQWVDDADAQAREHRMTRLRLIVLDADERPAEGAKLRLTQIDHDFRLGAPCEPSTLSRITERKPVYRRLTAISLEPMTAWPELQPAADAPLTLQPVDRALDASAGVVRFVRFGAVVSADPAKLPDWALRLEPAGFAQALDAHAKAVVGSLGPKVDGFDLYADVLAHRAVEDRLGLAGVRRMFQAARFARPGAALNLRVEGGLTAAQSTALGRRVEGLTGRLVPIQGLTLAQRLTGLVQQESIRRALERATSYGLPVTLAEIEVGGASPIAAAVNLETLLRHAFATPGVEGVYFAGLAAQDITTPHAALVDGRGEPTPAGRVVDELFGQVWRSEVQAVADEVGNVRARVFAGRYHAVVELPDGSRSEAWFHVPVSPTEQAVVIQPRPFEARRGAEAAAPASP